MLDFRKSKSNKTEKKKQESVKRNKIQGELLISGNFLCLFIEISVTSFVFTFLPERATSERHNEAARDTAIALIYCRPKGNGNTTLKAKQFLQVLSGMN